MTCAIHDFGARVLIESGVEIVNESTKEASKSSRRLEGTIKSIDRAAHKITVNVPEIGNIVVDADNVKKK